MDSEGHITVLDKPRPLKIINAVAPICIVDNGGWTDTWFSGHGSVFNVAVLPNVEVQVELFRRRGDRERIVVVAENYGERFEVLTGQRQWTHHPLLEAAIRQITPASPPSLTAAANPAVGPSRTRMHSRTLAPQRND